MDSRCQIPHETTRNPSGTVRINASQYAIDQVLLPKLASFRLLYPEVQLELISENRFVDIISEHFDAGVRLGNEVEEGTVAVRISPDLEMAVVATPEHLRRYSFPQTPHDLLQHPCIAYQFANCHDPCGSPWMMEDTGGVRASAGRGRSIL